MLDYIPLYWLDIPPNSWSALEPDVSENHPKWKLETLEKQGSFDHYSLYYQAQI